MIGQGSRSYEVQRSAGSSVAYFKVCKTIQGQMKESNSSLLGCNWNDFI